MNIPPKSIKKQIARTGVRGNPGRTNTGPAPISRNASKTRIPTAARMPADLAEIDSVSAKSLPVLQAFQDFLEEERKHARRQLTAVTMFFLFLFLIIAGAGAFFGYVYVGQMNDQIATLHSKLNQTKDSLKEETSEMIGGLADRTDDLSHRITDGDTLIKKATSEISSSVSNSLAMKLAQIEEIRQSLRDLQAENRKLKQDLARLEPVAPLVTSGIDTAVTIEASSSSPMTQPSGIEDVATVKKEPKPPQVSEAMAPLEIAILAPGTSKTIKWRIPISE